MKKIMFLLLMVLLVSLVAAELDTPVDEPDLYDDEFDKVIDEDIYDDVKDVELEGSAGLTPDSAFYFIENAVENFLVGDDPEKALAYKEEKILELREMVNKGNNEAAEEALHRVDKYNQIIQKEVSPDIEKRVRESSKAVKKILNSFELEGDLQKGVDESLKDEDKIALAAKISTKIGELCEALSALDPLEYSNVCKTDDDAPKWKRELDSKLTKEQEVEARKFFGIMTQCFQNPKSCRCDDISIKPFAEQCKIIAPLAAECEAGDEAACKKMEEAGDPIDLLPDYLQDVMDEVEDKFGESKHDLHVPEECVAEGALTREACSKVMFKVHAPEECLEALESGKIDPTNEKEGRDACEKIMFESNAPSECIEKGLKDRRECDRYMFRLDAPSECLDAGLDGSNRDDWKKCEAIRFKLDAPDECLSAGLDGSGRDDWKKCEAIRFKLEAPQECLNAGLDGSGRRDWDECNKMRDDLKEEDNGVRREECGRDQLHICSDDGFDCKCVNKEDYDGGDDPFEGCGAVDCKQGYYCERGECKQNEDRIEDKPESECKDGCSQECGDQNTDCREGMCVCLGYGENGPPGSGSSDSDGSDPGNIVGDAGSSGSDPGSSDSDTSDSGSSDSDSGSSDSGSDDSSSDSSDSVDHSDSDSENSDSGENKPTE